MLSFSVTVRDPISGFPTEFGNYFSSLRRIICALHKDRGTSLLFVHRGPNFAEVQVMAES